MISSTELDEIIMVLIRMIEDEEVASGCGRQEAGESYVVVSSYNLVPPKILLTLILIKSEEDEEEQR